MLKDSDRVKYTTEGFQEVIDSWTELPEEERYGAMELICTYMRN